MYFVTTYLRIVDELKAVYSIPPDPRIIERELNKIRWRDAKTKHFLAILKVLSEKGSCTIKDIVDNDGFSRSSNRVKARQDMYSRMINGKLSQKIPGLISRFLVVEDGTIMKSKPTTKYKLSLFGILYSIRVFSNINTRIAPQVKHEETIEIKDNSGSSSESEIKSILDVLAKNYVETLPLIFGKWNFWKNNFGSLVDYLVSMSRLNKDSLENLITDPLYNVRPFHMYYGMRKQSGRADEVTMWFITKIENSISHPKKFRTTLKKDTDIFRWYSEFIAKLLMVKKEEIWRIKTVEYMLKGEFEKLGSVSEKLLKFQGLDITEAKVSTLLY